MLRPFFRAALIDVLFWAGYCAFIVSMSAAFGQVTSGAVFIAVALSAELWAVGQAMRRIAHRRHWFELGPLRLAVRLFACVLIGAALSQLVLVPVLWVAATHDWVYLGPDNTAGFAAPMLVMYWAQTASSLALWTALWSWTVAMRRYREGEIARLNAESLRNASELDALRARLNPHFVFNALNNLRALINEDTERARELVTRLSSTLRHALDHSQREQVSVAEELTVVDDYLAVESVHYEDRLRVTREIDPAALDLRLPPMALQLLVENAIKHGIARTPGGGELSLRVRGDGGRLRIEVANPGKIEAESVRRGVGLAYLRTRLAHAATPGSFELRQHGARVHAHMEIPQ
ncbi:histidine kinase [Lysobacter sp. K5869]|uniref:sensor histidine kinase n=1 Tax=Lysobacter sp. K5869 TaxID=2820808 RepID=UPI001C0646BC|nr:histidine kinase [Lysobacter sp. K5869]QWP76666.1 histidine kinase [Lysobacter sp. K5869]